MATSGRGGWEGMARGSPPSTIPIICRRRMHASPGSSPTRGFVCLRSDTLGWTTPKKEHMLVK